MILLTDEKLMHKHHDLVERYVSRAQQPWVPRGYGKDVAGYRHDVRTVLSRHLQCSDVCGVVVDFVAPDWSSLRWKEVAERLWRQRKNRQRYDACQTSTRRAKPRISA